MNDVEFEKLLSAKPAHSVSDNLPCLRDMIFDYYCEVFSEDKANRLTKTYTDELFKMFVNRKM